MRFYATRQYPGHTWTYKETVPTLVWKSGKVTWAFHWLQCCAEEAGVVMPWYYKGGYWIHSAYRARITLQRLALFGWIEERRSGPRGGRRWHATELGCALIEAAKQGADTVTSMMVLLYK